MEIIYNEQGRVKKIIGSGENGDLTKNEQELAKKIFDDRHQEYMKAFEENRIIQVEMSKNQAEMSKTSSQTYGKFWDALGSLAMASCYPDPQPNQLPPNPNSQPKKVN